MLQLNLFAFSSGYNKHSLYILLDKFCTLIEKLNLPDQESECLEDIELEHNSSNELIASETKETVEVGVKCNHCETCEVCDNWLCNNCLSGSGLSSKFYCNIYQENFAN